MAEGPDGRPYLLLDGMSLAFRAFFALPTDIQTSSGLITNALHGFASMLASLVADHRPRGVAVAVDLPGGTFRDELAEDYKGGRAATPPEIEPQFDLIRGLCECLAIPVVGVASFEADDVLATLATRSRDAGRSVIVVSGDRDTFQLVEDPFVRVLYNRRGVSDYSLYDEAGIVERCGIEPRRYPLLAALRGDSSDNLPGVPGVGEKTAAKLFGQYRDLDELYEHLEDLTPKLRENLAAYEERVRNNADVMRLVRDVPLEVSLDDLHLGGWRREDFVAFTDRYELHTVRTRFERLMREGLLGEPSTGVAPAPVAVAPTVARATVRVGELAEVLAGRGALVVVPEAGRVALLDAVGGAAWVGEPDAAIDALVGRPFAGHDVKALYRRASERGIELADPLDDTAVMAFLLDAVSGRYGLADVAERYLGESTGGTPTLFGQGDEELAGAAALVARLCDALTHEVERWGLVRVYREIELPLVGVLGRMEARGIRVDSAMLRTIAEEFAAEAADLEAKIQELAGHPFKVNSPQQLQVVLFDELGLPRGKRIKTGYSTDAATLEAIADAHPVVTLILRYREVEKLRSTYGAPLIDAVASDGRIHATFNQLVARTGRISSENPNLQNIPVRTPEGRRLRYAFTAREGWALCVADYNQIELRILAHLSQDEGLLGAFAHHQDVHRAIAASVFGVAPADVTHEQREQAKAVSYGLAYGMEAFGLSQRLGISVADARAVMERYFEGFPSLRRFMDRTISEIRAQGYSRTEFGRIRPFPDLATAVGAQRQAAERQAMNAGIQGLAADVFKSALVRLDHALAAADLEARLVLQVHDEVLVEAPGAEREVVAEIVRDCLEHAAALSVPLEVSLAWGDNWAVAKE